MSSSTSSSSNLSISNLFSVEGLVVLVTGGHTGIGLMCSQALAQNGAKVYIMGRREDVLKQSAKEHSPKSGKGELIPIVGDTTDKESIQKVLKELEGKEKHLDILINNAGVAGPPWNAKGKNGAKEIGETMFENDFDDAVNLFKINCLGYFFMASAFIEMLDKSPNGPQIINITSNASFGREAMAGVLYSMTKAASTHLTKMLSTILKDTNVRCNAIAPGLFPSELTAGDSNEKNESELKDAGGLPTSKSSRGDQAGTVEDMASTVLYVANTRQRYLTGAVVLIDGGVLNTMPSSY